MHKYKKNGLSESELKGDMPEALGFMWYYAWTVSKVNWTVAFSYCCSAYHQQSELNCGVFTLLQCLSSAEWTELWCFHVAAVFIVSRVNWTVVFSCCCSVYRQQSELNCGVFTLLQCLSSAEWTELCSFHVAAVFIISRVNWTVVFSRCCSVYHQQSELNCGCLLYTSDAADE